VKFVVKNCLCVDVPSIKMIFYAACNDVLNKSRRLCETVQVHLLSLFCLPLLMYAIGALEFISGHWPNPNQWPVLILYSPPVQCFFSRPFHFSHSFYIVD